MSNSYAGNEVPEEPNFDIEAAEGYEIWGQRTLPDRSERLIAAAEDMKRLEEEGKYDPELAYLYSLRDQTRTILGRRIMKAGSEYYRKVGGLDNDQYKQCEEEIIELATELKEIKNLIELRAADWELEKKGLAKKQLHRKLNIPEDR